MMSLSGKRVVLVGGTAGLGVGLLRESVRLGAAKIWLLCRNEQRGTQVRADVLLGNNGATEITLVNGDLCSMRDVKAAGERICNEGEAIDIVFLNAGVMPGSQAVMTAEGIEEGLAVNVVSQVLLSRTLVDAFAPGARVIVTGSDAGGFVGWKVDLATINGQAKMGPGGFKQYCRECHCILACAPAITWQ